MKEGRGSGKKVLYVFSSSNYSGAEIVIARLIENNAGVEAYVACPHGTFGSLLQEKPGVTVFFLDALKSLNRSSSKKSKLAVTFKLFTNFLTINFRIASIVIRNNIDAIHANNLTPAVYILPVIKLFKLFKSKRKWVWSNHDLVYPDGVKMDKLASKCVSIYDLTLAVSQAVKNKFDQRLHNKIEVLYNGLDLKKFAFDARLRNDFRERNKVDDDTVIFAIVGLIISRKGHLFLIEAFKEILASYNNVKLFIVGKELPNEAGYGAEVRTHEDGNNIRLLAYTENVLELYSGIDVLVNASLPEMSEPLGTTIYEAMAVSRVVIASDTGGGPEIVSNNINGYLFEAGNLNSLIEKIKLVLDDWKNQETIRRNALKLVAEKFEVGIMVENYNKLLF